MLKQTRMHLSDCLNANLMIQISYMEVSNTGVGIGGALLREGVITSHFGGGATAF